MLWDRVVDCYSILSRDPKEDGFRIKVRNDTHKWVSRASRVVRSAGLLTYEEMAGPKTDPPYEDILCLFYAFQ